MSKSLINRDLYKVSIQNKPFSQSEINVIKEKLSKKYRFSDNELEYYIISDSIKNNAYSKNLKERINILDKNNKIEDIAIASDVSNVSTLAQIVEKHFVCHPKLL